jgi:site-specific recombinase XerD
VGHADLSTVSRYAHVASEEMHPAVQALADRMSVAAADAEAQAK